MKVKNSNNIVPDGPGSVEITPDENEDLWVAYNLIVPGDSVKATTVRKVLKESAAGGSQICERVKLTLEIEVQKTEYDKEGYALRIQGRNILENEHVRIGAFHTLEIDRHRSFVLRKDVWDELAREALKQAADPTASAELAVLLMREGFAQIFLVGKSVTVSCHRIEHSIPRKHGPGIATYEDAMDKFFEQVAESFYRCINFEVVRCAVIASPGFTKEQFHRRLLIEAERKDWRAIIENKAKIVEAHTTSGYRHSLKEVLDCPTVMNTIKDTQAAREVRALKKFFSMLSSDPDRACYGPKHVEVAHERLAIQTLLLTDELFRNPVVAERRKYSELVKSVREVGGTVHIFSTMHVSGEQLQQLTGVAAMLRYPLPELEDIEM